MRETVYFIGTDSSIDQTDEVKNYMFDLGFYVVTVGLALQSCSIRKNDVYSLNKFGHLQNLGTLGVFKALKVQSIGIDADKLPTIFELRKKLTSYDPFFFV